MSQTIYLEEYRRLLKEGRVPGCAKKRSARKQSPEEALQRTIVKWMALNEHKYPFLQHMFHVPNGGKRPAGEAGKMKALGVKPGVPDFLLPFSNDPACPVRYAGMMIELKAPGREKRVTADQARWIEAGFHHDYLVGVVSTLDKFVDYVRVFAGEMSESELYDRHGYSP